MGGSETYARELCRHLVGDARVDVTAYVPENAAGFAGGLPERVVRGVRTGPGTRERLTTLVAAGVRGPGIRAQQRGASVVHYPFTVPAPRPPRSAGFVQTLLDVQHLDLPDLFSAPELAYRRHFYEGAAARADVVITISEFAKQRMVELLGIAEDRVVVAPLGVDLGDYQPNLGPRENFVLFPARGWPHKNHARLIEAMHRVREELPGMRLVLTGGDLDRLGDLPEWVDRRGLVSGEELRELYRTAAALAFPSLYEGFGLPPIEAMASGCPVAASQVGSVPEVCGDAAVLFDPHEPESIAEGIIAAIAQRSTLVEKGLAQAASLTWDRCRDIHIEVYQRFA